MRVIVAEDGGLFHDYLVTTLPQHGLTVIGRAKTTAELMALVKKDPPDVVTLDIMMPIQRAPADRSAGMDAAREIRAGHPEVGILMLSNHGELSWVEAVLALGNGVGYQLKDRVDDMTALVQIIRTVASGGVRLDETLVSDLIRRPRINDPLAELLPREHQVLTLMAKGWSNSAIAWNLNYSVKVIEEVVSAIYRKLDIHPDDGINKRVQAVLAFLRWGPQ
jgi:DNA-binding NarL/FixJ family response regulator